MVVLLGDGDGTFTAAPNVSSVGEWSYALTLGDVNEDQNLDLAVKLLSSDGNDDNTNVFLGNGDGTFGLSASLAIPIWGSDRAHRMTFADMDADGNQDLVVMLGNVTVAPGNGDGTFGAPQPYCASGGSGDVGDFDLDSWLDVAGVSSTVNLLFNQSGPETFGFAADGVTLSWPAVRGALFYRVYRGDLAVLVDTDDDGLPDSGYGACKSDLDDDPRDTFFEDTDVPSPAGAGYFYLTSVVDSGGDSGLGTTSAGLPRMPEVPCH